MKLTPELAEAICKLRPYPAFQLFLEGINQDGITAMLNLVRARGDAIGPLQGKAEEAQSILGAVSDADAYLEKLMIAQQRNTGEDGHHVRSTRTSPRTSGIS
jgi:hypothetical protein